MYKGKNVLITGASSGLGKVMALTYAKEKATIINLSRNVLQNNPALAYYTRASFLGECINKNRSLKQFMTNNIIQCFNLLETKPQGVISVSDVLAKLAPLSDETALKNMLLQVANYAYPSLD
jgi:NAD(P)-dependent dehydrogenase (short-subunit alcohol dehydrogenase family)